MKKRTKILIISIIVIAFITIIGLVIKHSYANEEIIDNDTTILVIMKKDNETEVPLSGIKFRLWGTSDTNEEVDKEVTSVDGELKFENVPPGQYYLQETHTPDSYERDLTVYTVRVN